MSGHGRTLSLRTWLILAVIAIVGVCGITEAAVAVTLYHGAWQAGYHGAAQVNDAQMASVRRILGTGPSQWQQAGWQRRATRALGTLDVDVALFAERPGQIVFATPGARQLLDTSLLARAGGPARSTGLVTLQPSGSASSALPLFTRLVITDPAPSGVARRPIGIAFLWFTRTPSTDPLVVLFPVAGMLMFALSLALVAWLMRRPVLQPLAAMSQAVEGMAGGDLEVHLPSSPVREIAVVTSALEGMSGALRDSLARQSALEEDRRMFIGAIAHDLRTPLFILRAHLRGLQAGIAATPEKVREYVDECAARAEALERLIADLFAFTRLEYLEQEPERTPLELGALLRQMIEGIQPLALAKNIALVPEGPEGACPLMGDSHLLTRAIENLLSNAVRHTPPGGQIRVRWRCAGDHLTFTVADTGPGILPQDLPHLFTPLYRGETSRNRRTGGAGLGLTIARRILRAHGGDLSAANGSAGGAVFMGKLPALRQAPA